MILLQANKIARHFGADILFDNIQMEISSGSRIALVGRNGAGKSTLLKIIAGIDPPDEGTVSKNKNISLGYLAQNTGLISTRTVWHEMLTVFEELIAMEKRMRELEIIISSLEPEKAEYEMASKEYDRLQYAFSQQNGYSYENEIRSVLHGFHFDDAFYQKEISTLSGGQKTRLALAKILLQKPEILILDEPTNHLDIETLSWLENYLPSYSGALLIVSHDRYFLDKVVNEVYEISRHKMYYYKGNYSKYLELKAADLTAEWKAYEKQQTEINKLEDFIARNIVRSSTTKRAQSRRKVLEKMDRLDRPQGKEKVANFLFNVKKNSGNIVLQVDEAAIGYGKTSLSTPISIDLRRQDAIAIVGPNGIGKSTLLKSIIGKIPFMKGQAVLGTNVQIGYYDQEQSDLHSNKTILAELWDEYPTVAEKEIRSVLGGFLFSGQEVEKSVPLLSGGEKARLALAKLSMNQSNFLILDEPTNHLDIDNKEVLENALITYEGSLLFVSHDRYFINRIATKVIELSETGSKLYLGDYDYYLEKKKEKESLAELLAKETIDQKITATNTQKNDFYQTKAQQKFIRSLNRKIEAIEEELATLDTEIHELECSMNDPKYLDNHQELLTLTQELEQKKQTQENLLSEWVLLGIKLEEIKTN